MVMPIRHGYYQAIVADPPWTFKVWSNKGKGRSAEAWYDCLSLDDIKKMPVSKWAAQDCTLFLWTTDPMLPQALEVITSWGFTYKTIGFVWAKSPKDENAYLNTPGTYGRRYVDRDAWPIGTGYWTRANPEICLFGTRGKPKRLSRSVRKLIVSPRREHSRKPDETYERIEALCAGPYLELFARSRRPGWDALGLEVDTGIGLRRWKSTGPGKEETWICQR